MAAESYAADDVLMQAEKRGNSDPHLLQIGPGTVSDQPHGPKRLVRRAHHFSKCRRDGWVVQNLKDDHWRTRKLLKALHLTINAGIGVTLSWAHRTAECRRRRKSHHWRHLWKARLDARVHVAGVLRADLKQLDDIAHRWRVKGAQLFQNILQNCGRALCLSWYWVHSATCRFDGADSQIERQCVLSVPITDRTTLTLGTRRLCLLPQQTLHERPLCYTEAANSR